MTELTTEFLSKLQENLLQFQDHYSDPADKENYDIFVDALHVLDEFKAAKEKLLAYEQAAKNPLAWVATDSEGFPEYNSHNEFSADCGAGTPLYAAPVLPKQPELPQGFTYESGIMTANFGNGDILISDTHWTESGHAGISFAPVPQPKRPNLSDYTDLLGGSKPEDIGALFIVKSNSAESLIAIRNKLDIAINSLSPAPAQPVIPEQRQIVPDERHADSSNGNDAEAWFDEGWNACRAEILKAQQNEPQNIPENIPAQPVIPEGLIKAINLLLDNDGSRGRFSAIQSYDAREDLERLLASTAQPVSEPYKLPNSWISIKDDTPTESGNYWCYLGKDFESLTKQCVMHFDVRHHEFQDYRVTHWMHLPAEPAQEV